MPEIERRAALVTGSSRGIGRATALALAASGHDVVVHYRREEARARAVAGELRILGVEAVVVRAELEEPDEIAFAGGETPCSRPKARNRSGGRRAPPR